MFNYLTAETLRQAALFNLYATAYDSVDRFLSLHMAIIYDSENLTDGQREAIRLLNTVGKNYSTYRQTDKFMLLLFLAEFVSSENELEKEHIKEEDKAKYAQAREAMANAFVSETLNKVMGPL